MFRGGRLRVAYNTAAKSLERQREAVYRCVISLKLSPDTPTMSEGARFAYYTAVARLEGLREAFL